MAGYKSPIDDVQDKARRIIYQFKTLKHAMRYRSLGDLQVSVDSSLTRTTGYYEQPGHGLRFATIFLTLPLFMRLINGHQLLAIIHQQAYIIRIFVSSHQIYLVITGDITHCNVRRIASDWIEERSDECSIAVI